MNLCRAHLAINLIVKSASKDVCCKIILAPTVVRRIKFNEAKDRIKFHSQTSKELFLKLLSDSYLKSELTELLYESDDKEELSKEDDDD